MGWDCAVDISVDKEQTTRAQCFVIVVLIERALKGDLMHLK